MPSYWIVFLMHCYHGFPENGFLSYLCSMGLIGFKRVCTEDTVFIKPAVDKWVAGSLVSLSAGSYKKSGPLFMKK